MGQPITVVETRSSNPAIVRFETNRPLSGLGHERYTEAPPEILDRPVDELARRLFAAGGVEAVHVNGSVATVTLAGGRTGDGLADVVRGLFLHYADAPAAPESSDAADAPPEALADTATAPAADEPAAAATPPSADGGGEAPAESGSGSAEGAPAAEAGDVADDAPVAETETAD